MFFLYLHIFDPNPTIFFFKITGKEWNTIQEFKVGRKDIFSRGRPVFGKSGGRGGSSDSSSGGHFDGGDEFENNINRPSSWLTGVDNFNSGPGYYNKPVRITDIYKEMGYNNNREGGDGKGNTNFDNMVFHERRIQIPNDEELNNVLGGGIMPGSLTLVSICIVLKIRSFLKKLLLVLE